jgi:hypothetical protein
MPKLSVKQVQEMIGVEDDVIICHGYSFDIGGSERLTYDVWFNEGKLFRAGYDINGNVKEFESAEHFESYFFLRNVKRWYEATVHPMLSTLIRTFGGLIPTTPGGHMPSSLPNTNGLSPFEVVNQ